MSKNQDKIISEHFRKLAKDGWGKRRKKILDTAKKVVSAKAPPRKSKLKGE